MKRILLGYKADGKPIYWEPDDRKAHCHVIGSSGSGKSKFLESVLREDLRAGHGFCLLDPHGTLYDDLAAFCAHRVLGREIIYLNLSKPDSIVSFNPFEPAPEGDISVQVEQRVTAVCHAWGVRSTDETPTLARTLRLIFAVMLERRLGLQQVQHLIDFNARQIRGNLIEQISTPLIQKEWRELQDMKSREWREETLSARNRLWKFLTSTTLCRFMGVPGRTLNLTEIMKQGKVLLVNLAPSDHLSYENARAFGALLVNEFFEHALRRKRDALGRPPAPFFLVMDEFANFVSLRLTDMLDQTRKFGLFTMLAHQRFGQLDENILDAVLTNCRIKVCFGGLPTTSARLMAEELFCKLDPMKVKVAIYQTKFWPEYRRDKVYSRGSSHGSSSGTSSSSSSGSSSGLSSGMSYDGSYFTPDKWFAFSNGFTRSEVSSSGSSSMSSSGTSQSDSWSDSEGEADIPIFFPVPFEELSSIQYYTPEEQLNETTTALKNQFQRHCFIKLLDEETQPLLVPFVEDVTSFRDSDENLRWYIGDQNRKQDALPPPEIDRLLEAQETALLQETLATGTTVVDVEPDSEAEAPPSKVISVAAGSAWQRPAGTPPKAPRKKPTP